MGYPPRPRAGAHARNPILNQPPQIYFEKEFTGRGWPTISIATSPPHSPLHRSRQVLVTFTAPRSAIIHLRIVLRERDAVRVRSCAARVVFTVLLCWLPTLSAAQANPASQDVPDKFNLDMKTAARLRSELLAQSTVPTGRYALGRRVFETLVERVETTRLKYGWELRIVDDAQLNAFSSPDGTIYVASGLADLAGTSAGLWAAILSHEIAHVVRRDWARRYLYEESLRSGSGSIVLGDPGLPSAAWSDSTKASADLRASAASSNWRPISRA